jgi:glucose-6-phosphate isomerase
VYLCTGPQYHLSVCSYIAAPCRSVLHVATRAPRNKVIMADGRNVVADVWDVLDKVKDFSDKVRNGEWLGGRALIPS